MYDFGNTPQTVSTSSSQSGKSAIISLFVSSLIDVTISVMSSGEGR
jgi:hypothetical protein